MGACLLIPARYASSRFEGKPLAMIAGKPMIEHVWRQCKKSKLTAEVVVLTDNEAIFETVEAFGGKVMMTSASHPTGTDRLIEASKKLNFDYYINVQGDEPLIDPALIDSLIKKLGQATSDIVTACHLIDNSDDLFSYNVVKVVRDVNEKALYFSRQAIPAHRDIPYKEWLEASDYYKHLGVYGYTALALLKIEGLEMSSLEKAESLEQLRWLEAGMSVHCLTTDYISIGVDVPEDIAKVENLM